jgi:hypothetical protein
MRRLSANSVHHLGRLAERVEAILNLLATLIVERYRKGYRGSIAEACAVAVGP